MDLTHLTKIVDRRKKRIGRGHGSGKVKTAGRGTKGQKARDATHAGFEGGQLPLIKRLPLLRGKGRNNSRKQAVFALDIRKLALLGKEKTVTLEILRKYHMIPTGTSKAKIIGNAEVSQAYTVHISCSARAKASIEKAGGQVT